MEENNNMESANKADEVVAQESAPAEVSTPETEVAAQPKTVQPEVKQVRKNGRNRGSSRNSKNCSANNSSREVCGELENPSAFQEKLSGQNVSGYPESEGYSEENNHRERKERRGDRFERRERKDFRKRDNAEAEIVEVSNEAESATTSEDESNVAEHKGPSFESKKFTPRAVEVALSDHRPKNKIDSNVDDKVVSYSFEDNKCSISLFDRIKNIVRSIFGKSDKSKKRYNKNSGKKNWNNSRENGKHFNNRKGGKGGYNKRRYNDRRPNGGKPKGNGKPQA